MLSSSLKAFLAFVPVFFFRKRSREGYESEKRNHLSTLEPWCPFVRFLFACQTRSYRDFFCTSFPKVGVFPRNRKRVLNWTISESMIPQIPWRTKSSTSTPNLSQISDSFNRLISCTMTSYISFLLWTSYIVFEIDQSLSSYIYIWLVIRIYSLSQIRYLVKAK